MDVFLGVSVFFDEMDVLLKIYVEGKYVMFLDDKYWVDVNFILCIIYGNLEGFVFVDGMVYIEYMILKGMIDKYWMGNFDFELLLCMLELYDVKDYGNYG